MPTVDVSNVGTWGHGQSWRVLGGDTSGASVFIVRDGNAPTVFFGVALWRSLQPVHSDGDVATYLSYGAATWVIVAQDVIAQLLPSAYTKFPALPLTIQQRSATDGHLLHEVIIPNPTTLGQYYTIDAFAGTSSGAIFIRTLHDTTVTPATTSQDIGTWNSDGTITWTTLTTTIPATGSTPEVTGVTLALQAGQDLVTVGGASYVPCGDGHWRRIV